MEKGEIRINQTSGWASSSLPRRERLRQCWGACGALDARPDVNTPVASQADGFKFPPDTGDGHRHTKTIRKGRTQNVGTNSVPIGTCQLSRALHSTAAQGNLLNSLDPAICHIVASRGDVPRHPHRNSLLVCAHPYETTT